MTDRKDLDFYSLPQSEQEWFLRESWCDTCSQADLGIKDPQLYIENNIKHVAGNCIACNTLCISTITEHQANG